MSKRSVSVAFNYVTTILKMMNADRQQVYDTLKRMIVLAKMKSGGENDK